MGGNETRLCTGGPGGGILAPPPQARCRVPEPHGTTGPRTQAPVLWLGRGDQGWRRRPGSRLATPPATEHPRERPRPLLGAGPPPVGRPRGGPGPRGGREWARLSLGPRSRIPAGSRPPSCRPRGPRGSRLGCGRRSTVAAASFMPPPASCSAGGPFVSLSVRSLHTDPTSALSAFPQAPALSAFPQAPPDPAAPPGSLGYQLQGLTRRLPGGPHPAAPPALPFTTCSSRLLPSSALCPPQCWGCFHPGPQEEPRFQQPTICLDRGEQSVPALSFSSLCEWPHYPL
ncbi:uncharacterized protein [Muntiacus reevesi]|uniref:uncharacterized protein n=1 Tax=Muntiacus reevesi TaxID=9886 RepID=UPI003307C16B